jgi:hypothetical protein
MTRSSSTHRRSIFPTRDSLMRMVGTLLAEQGRRVANLRPSLLQRRIEVAKRAWDYLKSIWSISSPISMVRISTALSIKCQG